jgi:CRP-like cAMP-binding protein
MDKIEVLQKSKLFENLLQEELNMLGDLSQRRQYLSGETIVEEGEPGNSLFVIIEGEVEVLRKSEGGAQKKIAELKAPDFFGEMSLIDKEVRSATIRAKSDTAMLILTTENLHSFARVYKNGFTMVVINIARVLSMRLRETTTKLTSAL